MPSEGRGLLIKRSGMSFHKSAAFQRLEPGKSDALIGRPDLTDKPISSPVKNL